MVALVFVLIASWYALIAAGVIGWVLNVIDLVQTLGGAIDTLFIARVAGIALFPLGAVLGWIT